jgi:hypothetical protein
MKKKIDVPPNDFALLHVKRINDKSWKRRNRTTTKTATKKPTLMKCHGGNQQYRRATDVMRSHTVQLCLKSK